MERGQPASEPHRAKTRRTAGCRTAYKDPDGHALVRANPGIGRIRAELNLGHCAWYLAGGNAGPQRDGKRRGCNKRSHETGAATRHRVQLGTRSESDGRGLTV